ncbi:HAD-like domain-containing protein [Phascolomyces articulosus]|uniref:HAD-like domain-containing protein n=1 Tax=Phascolomyces articulosus TaxID=60185 RepID=A0AAD5K7A9_9FUNG|nr:HAD-like domain-containing protein [Phascolomyces articulosus]
MLPRLFSLSNITATTRLHGYRAFSSKVAPKNYAFAFDIDGVLIKGKRTIPEAKRAIRMLNGDNAHGRHVPFVLLTNGGGVTEQAKAEQISNMLDVEISPDQVILSHSPMQALVEQYKNKNVLVVGGKDRECFHVAKKYGFNHVFIPDDIHHWQASVWPFRHPSRDSISPDAASLDFSKIPFGAVMVFHDSRDWGRDIQIMLDAICAENGVVGTQKGDCKVQEVPVYFSNTDIIWSTEFPVPRLAQGSFKMALENVYHTLTGTNLQSTSYGKPYPTTYAYAERVIERINDGKKPSRIYAVGDNPAADIKGANNYGWTSVLVRTGVFQEPGNSPHFPAHSVCQHVEEAVEWVLQQEEDKEKKA